MINISQKYKKRNPSIELARIIGCLIVIGVHTLLGYEFEDLFYYCINCKNARKIVGLFKKEDNYLTPINE